MPHPHPGVRLGAGVGGRHAEGGVDPAVGVHHPLGDLLHDAVYRVPDVLLGRHQGARRDQDHEGRLASRTLIVML